MQLNPQQQAAVDFGLDQSCLVMAGAGSGKTAVIVRRALRVLDNIPGDKHIQMLTFSNKAAKEMKERVRRIAPAALELIRFDTFHSFGMKMIRSDPEGFGLNAGFSLLSDYDVKRSIRAGAKSAGMPKSIPAEDRRRLNPINWLSTWSLARQAGYDVRNPANEQALRQRLKDAHQLDAAETDMAWTTLSGYEQEKRLASSIDFDDLLYLPLLRVAQDPEFRATQIQQLAHVLVDESQDTNRIQYELLRRLVAGHCPVTCVGDDDQSIYGWRGAEVTNLKRFIKHFSATELKLEQNYRSTQSIVDAATRLIRHNTDRLDKSPFSTSEQGEPVGLVCVADSRSMSEYIATRIRERIERGTAPRDIAVLYRTNRMALLIEQSLRRQGVPYHVVGGMSLFDRAEIVAVTSALRLAANPRDVYALKSLIPYIDGIGAAGGQVIQDWLEADDNRSLVELPDQLPGLTPARMTALVEFYNQLIHGTLASETAGAFINWVVKGPMRVLEREKDDVLRAKRANHLEAMAEDITQELMERQQDNAKLTWHDVVMDAALREARQSQSSDGQVTLSTIHRSKGLEWDHVFVPGLSEGLMPLDNSAALEDDEAGFSHVEEERRLAYVGFTRAKKTCEAVHADSYFFPGDKTERQYTPSRFAQELGLTITHQARHTLDDWSSQDGDLDAAEVLANFSTRFQRGISL